MRGRGYRGCKEDSEEERQEVGKEAGKESRQEDGQEEVGGGNLPRGGGDKTSLPPRSFFSPTIISHKGAGGDPRLHGFTNCTEHARRITRELPRSSPSEQTPAFRENAFRIDFVHGG